MALGAKGLIYASLFEGFGLPVLEAMARGVPVATMGVGKSGRVGRALMLITLRYADELRNAPGSGSRTRNPLALRSDSAAEQTSLSTTRRAPKLPSH